MPELKYHFETLGTHDSLIVQQAIEKRITDMTSDLKGTDKAIKAVVEELERMHDDLSRHIAENERREDFHEKEKKENRPIIISE